MLTHIGQVKVAEKVQNAWLKTIEDGIHTYDIFKEGVSKQKVGTMEFAQAVINNLGQLPTQFKSVHYTQDSGINVPKHTRKVPQKKDLVGVDLFVHWHGTDANILAEIIKKIESEDITLNMITNRGIKVYPDGFPETFCTDHWRCRFKPTGGGFLSKKQIIELLTKAEILDIDIIKTENLYNFNDKPAYSLGQGQ